MNIVEKLKTFIHSVDEIQKSKAAEAFELEEKELKNIFSLLVFGSFVGLPAAPVHITNELLPEMKDEFQLMVSKVNMANDPLAELFSVLDIG